ncbi:hypothetical protein J437_LFUL008470 [Ladona fulva]|uniref:Sidoreflexin n=1 Tax=Ladona fulva TaxID=123851 RepID=A0A8K0NZI1_LADFU|nr:hypothetical protein J437_LFUL008470 [Ladona fulva]
MTTLPRINLDEPRWDQSTYSGRAKHFFTITNPLNLLVSPSELERARTIVKSYRAGEDLPDITEDDIWKAKHLYDSAYHPDTGEKMFILGRMSAQVPMNMTITGCMMTFYKTTPAVVFWQWINQSFNALVNYTNRSGDSPIPVSTLGTSYVLATGGALVTALGLNSLVKKAPPLIGRWVPFAAVAAANCVNIPMMRMKELQEGVPVTDENGNKIGESKVAARTGIASVTLSRILMASPGMGYLELQDGILVTDEQGERLGQSKVAAHSAITQVVLSRIAMASPSMGKEYVWLLLTSSSYAPPVLLHHYLCFLSGVTLEPAFEMFLYVYILIFFYLTNLYHGLSPVFPPILMNILEKRGTLARYPWASAPLQVFLCGFCLTFATPMCCALFPQKSSLKVSSLEDELQEKIKKLPQPIDTVYYNKGL